ncbi:MAG: glycosyltransferase [Lachnospiraceae bacterium]|nr:glycosyltransferase [Lachnospiraceae bacterium]
MDKKLSVVMPAFNEGKNIYKNLLEVSNILSGFLENYEIIAVNDGSLDNTREEMIRCKEIDEHVHPVSYKKNKGKGHAIRVGVMKASGDYIAFLDSDLDLPPDQLEDYVKSIAADEADVIIGSKMHKDSELEYPLVRRVISTGYYCMLRGLFHLKVKDTQTGLKVFKAEALKSIISLIQTEGYAYDIEILVALNCRGCTIKEMPVRLVFQRGNKMGRIRLKDIFKVFKDTFAIFYRANIKKYYQKK